MVIPSHLAVYSEIIILFNNSQLNKFRLMHDLMLGDNLGTTRTENKAAFAFQFAIQFHNA